VVDLKHINLATEEDKRSHRDLWARFFKAQTWDLKMITQQNAALTAKDAEIARLKKLLENHS
jgi:hypothetical protein